MNNKTSKLTSPKGVLFDFDGVIVDSFDSHYGAWSSAFHELFGVEISEFPHTLAGSSPKLIAKHFCNVIGKENQAEKLYFLKDKHLDENFLDENFTPPKLLPGVNEVAAFLKKRNIPYGIASNATKLFLKNSIKHLKIDFPTAFGLQDFTKPKPDPEAYITLAKALGFSAVSYTHLTLPTICSV